MILSSQIILVTYHFFETGYTISAQRVAVGRFGGVGFSPSVHVILDKTIQFVSPVGDAPPSDGLRQQHFSATAVAGGDAGAARRSIYRPAHQGYR